MTRLLHGLKQKECKTASSLLFFLLLTVLVYGQLTVDFDLTEPICGGDAGSISAIANGGTAPYDFAWNTGDQTATIIITNGDTYSVTVTDATDEQVVQSIEVTDNADLDLNLMVKDISCPGENDGSICLGISGGQSPYTFAWSNGATSREINDLASGSYKVTVTDGNGCRTVRAFVVAEPAALDLSVDITNVSCYGLADGVASGIASGGTGPYKFKWSTSKIGDSADGLKAGTYSVTVYDQQDCSASMEFTVGQPGILHPTIEITNPICGTATKGSITITPQGGTEPYTYQWEHGPTTASITDLAAGTFTVTITDANNCKTVRSAEIIIESDLDVILDVTDVSDCSGTAADGSASVAVTGSGGPPYTIEWSTGESGESIMDLSPGSYSVTVSNALGCSLEKNFSISGNNRLAIAFETEPIVCTGEDDGSITAMISGGTAPYSYQWNTGDQTASITVSSGGIYNVVVTDAAGCRTVRSVEMSGGSVLNLEIMSMDISCFEGSDGSIWSSVSGGQYPYTFAWSNGATDQDIQDLEAGTYTVLVTDASGCSVEGTAEVGGPDTPLTAELDIDQVCGEANVTAIVSGASGDCAIKWSDGQAGKTAVGLAPGEYFVSITNANGCNLLLPVNIEGVEELTCTITVDAEVTNGNDGALSVTVNGGSGAYTYEWSDGQTTPQAENLAAGNYTVTATDANGCTTTCDFTLETPVDSPCENITDPGAVGNDQMICGPGVDPEPFVSIRDASGGEGEIEYLWMMSTQEGPFDPDIWTPIPDSNSPTYDPGPLTYTTYFARCARRAECISFLETNIVKVVVKDDAVASIGGPEAVCQGTTMSFSSEEHGAGAQIHWELERIGSTIANADGPEFTYTFDNTGIFYVILYVTENGCTSMARHKVFVTTNPTICGTGFVIDASAMDTEQQVKVKWQLQPGIFSKQFTIEYSADGERFSKLGEVEQPTATENGVDYHEFIHKAPKKGWNYYRVVMADRWGNSTSSDVVDVVLDSKSKFLIAYPNPVQDQLTLELFKSFDEEITFDIFNINGLRMDQMEVAGDLHRQTIDFSNYPAGAYFLRVRYSSGDLKVVQVIKE